ncbi:MAG: DUF1028 domain-containing protein [Acidimicrobiales bacterium]
MTFSIVARSSDCVSFGVAVASKFLAVGAVVPAARVGVGALATQSYANTAYRAEGLRLLAEGGKAPAVVGMLTSSDEQRELRQVGMVDAAGGSATYTGTGCHPWAGGRGGDGYAVQGNILTGEEVVAEIERAWLAAPPEQPLARRLLSALAAGDVAGGDRRGRQSAALFVVTPRGGYAGGDDVQVDLRVDDHRAPVTELGRLLDLHDLYFTTTDPTALVPVQGGVLAQLRDALGELGYRVADGTAATVMAALEEWAGRENLEKRVAHGAMVDPVVLRMLQSRAGTTQHLDAVP